MNAIWYKRGWQSLLLLPVSLLFRFIVFTRTTMYRCGMLQVNTFSVPVIVVGNISVGGTGKTPIVIALVKYLQQAGFNPGVVSRGYGAEPAKIARHVNANTPTHLAGDEPALIARETGAAVCICANRSQAVNAIVQEQQVDVVISDDGLQHYAMHRDIEIAVIDGQRLLGNSWLLPAGPLRELPARLNRTNLIAMQHSPVISDITRRSRLFALQLPATNTPAVGHFHLAITGVVGVVNGQRYELNKLKGSTVHAMAGVGNPNRFFDSLKRAGLTVIEHAMPDHHRYAAADLSFDDDLAVLVTTKDAVKIREINTGIDLSSIYEVTAEAQLDEKLASGFERLNQVLGNDANKI